MHRLRSAEYHNTIGDLLGVDATSPAPDEAKPYEALITDVTPWLAAVSSATQQLFNVPVGPLAPPPFDCVFPAGADRECATAIVDDLGLRAFRRPVLDQERVAFLRVYDDLRTTDGPLVAIEQMVRAMLLSPAFLFHVELSDDPDGDTPERLDSYALAARLSFALGRTGPDAGLLAAAKSGLDDDAAFAAEVERVQKWDRSREEADGLVDVWLGADQLGQHEVDPNVFPAWNALTARNAVSDERVFMSLFLQQGQPLNQLLTLQQGERTGALGQVALLALPSLPRRTSATLRGKYVLETLLCRPVPEPPPNSSTGLGVDYPAGQTERGALEAVVTSPACKACHSLLDPIGYALGNYDALGNYRDVDASGTPIDAAVTLPNGYFATTAANGLGELAQAITSAPDFPACVAQQLASYLLHREVTPLTDPELLAQLGSGLTANASLRDLTRGVIMSNQFRYRRLPAP
jgi:hypothetical protein